MGSTVRIGGPRRGTWILTSEIELPVPIEAVFRFFSDARNLERLTPPWLRFAVVTPAPIEMLAGTRIDYHLRIRGVPIRWQSEITVWEPPLRFVDEQRRGPYRLWRHEHAFRDCDGTTLVADRVEYAAPLGRLVNELFVARDLRQIFAFRGGALADMFAGPKPRLSSVRPGR
jgi:ligand-binding SRPBCC domain-containing protein